MIVTNKKLKLSIIVVVMMIAMCMVLAGCKADKTTEGNMNSAAQTENAEMVTDDNGEQFASEEAKGTPVETKYITLYLPEDLEDKLSVERDKEGGVHRIVASTEISGEPLELFTILMSTEEQDGYKVGVLKDDKAGDIIVTVQMNQQKEEDWDEKEFDEINELQERVNDFIYQIAEDERYVPEK